MKKNIYVVLITTFLLVNTQIAHASATTTISANYFCDWESGIVGASTTATTLGTDCHSDGGNTFTWTSASTATYYTATSTAIVTLPVPVNVNGTFYANPSTQSIAFDMNVSNQDTHVIVGTSKNEVVVSGYIFSDIGPPCCGLNQKWDLIQLAGSGQSGIIQENASTSLAIYVHTSNHTGSFQGGIITPIANHKYYYTLRWSKSRLSVDLSLYDPANNYALVGTSTSPIIADGTNTGIWNEYQIINDHSLQSKVSNVYDNVIFDYTNVTYPLVPDAVVPQVGWITPANGGTVSGTSVLLDATSSDNSNLLGVQFFVGNNSIGSQITATTTAQNLNISTNPSFTATTTWDSTSVSNGTYTLYAVAEDASGNYATTSESVTVSNITAPSVTTNSASSLAQTTSTLNGQVTATGGQDATQSGFAYGTDSTLATVIATSTLGAQTGTASFTSNVSSLTCNTTYYFRAYASNSGGTGYGSIQSFTTSACDVVSTSPTVSNTSMSSSASTPSSLFYPGILVPLTVSSAPSLSVPQIMIREISGIDRILYITERGKDVRNLQQFLIATDYLFPGNDTGYFGPLTRQALKLYQKEHSIRPTGNFGPLTEAFIRKSLLPFNF